MSVCLMAENLAKRVYAVFQRGCTLLRFRSFDVSTADGRSQERLRRAMLTTIASALSKVVSVITVLISVPLTLHYLGPERYGMWMTMSSVVAMLNFADFGIGNGVLNAVSSAYGQERHESIREHVSSGFFVLFLVALGILTLFAAAFPFVTWYKLFNVVSPLARQDAGLTFAVLVACFALTIPFTVVQRTQLGLQCGFVSSLWQCAGSLLALIAVVFAIVVKASLPLLMLAFVGSPLLIAAVNSLVFFVWQEPRYAPRLAAVSRRSVGQILHIGFLFFVMQLVGVVMFSSDNIVIAQMLGAASVTAYAVPQRMFAVIAMVLGMALVPLWPAYGEALARKDYGWVKKILKKSFWFSIWVSGALSVMLCFGGNWILKKWVGGDFSASLMLLAGLGLWQIIQAGGTAVSVYLNGANVVVFQVVTGVVAAVAALVLKVYLVTVIGISGVVWATNLTYLVFVCVPMFFFLRLRFKTGHRI